MKGKCIMGEMRKDRTLGDVAKDYIKTLEKAAADSKAAWEKEHKLRQEAETETILVKGIGMNSPEMKKAQARIKELESNRSLDSPMDEIAYNEVKHRVKELDNSLAIALEINESHQRYNGKLQTRVTELEEDNKKLSSQIEDKIDTLRKAGL